MWKAALAAALIVAVLVPALLFAAILAGVQEIAGDLTIRPQTALVADAWSAAERCPLSESVVLSAATLTAAAYVIGGSHDLLGRFRNPWGAESFIPARYRRQAASDLGRGGETLRQLGVSAPIAPSAWTTILSYAPVGAGWAPAPGGVHGFGFLLLVPAVWTSWVAQVPGGGGQLDPFSPLDALTALACHLRHDELAAGDLVDRLSAPGLLQPLQALAPSLTQLESQIGTALAAIQARFQSGGAQGLWSAASSVLGDVGSWVLGHLVPDVEAAMAVFQDLRSGGLVYQPSAFAGQDIPAAYLALFQKWGAQYGVDWTVLAGVGRVETDFGRSTLPGVSSGTNAAGAAGPMQFEAATFARYEVPSAGAPPDLYDPAQAIAAAANYLASLGATDATQDQQALCHYNAGYGDAYQACLADPDSYAAQVLAFAQAYRGAPVAPSGTLAGDLPWPELPLSDAVGTETAIPPIAWPAGTASHVAPPTVTNQCVAGALWTWGVMHAGDPRWNPPPALTEADAWQYYPAAEAAGFQVTGPDQPVVGSMVVYASGWGGSGPGHIATVIAVQGSVFEVIEQNVIDTSFEMVYAWNVFDLRIDRAGSPGIEGFIVAPPGA